jgi:hypothetical protein
MVQSVIPHVMYGPAPIHGLGAAFCKRLLIMTGFRALYRNVHG